MKNMKRIFVILIVAYTTIVNGQMIISTGDPVTLISTYLSGCNVTLSNITFIGQTGATGASQIGYFSNGNVTNLGINEGIVLASGDVTSLAGPVGTLWSTVMGGGGDYGLTQIAGVSTYDAAVIEFDIIPTGNFINLEYVFGSEEYLEYVNSGYNDVFGFFVSGPRPGGGNYNDYNMALVPGTSVPVSIDNVNNVTNSAYYINNEALGGTSIVLDGFTSPLLASVQVIPGELYHIKIAVADAGDYNLDSSVFLRAYSLSTGSGSGGLSLTTYQSGNACAGMQNVSAWVNVSGGTAPYSYQWSSGQTDSVAHNLSAGNYSITVTDAYLCQSICSLVVESVVFDVEVVSFPAVCNSSDGIALANVTLGFDDPYIYEWSNGQTDNTVNTSSMIFGLNSGIYSVTVTNGLGCVDSVTTFINNISGPEVYADTIIDATCAANDGLISLYVGNPANPPYTFTIPGYLPVISNDSAEFSALAPGHYIIEVLDTNNCTTFIECEVESPPLPYAMFTYSVSQNLVNFHNQSSQGMYFWDFGDSGGSTLEHPDHVYQNPGAYVVCLWYYGTCGNTSFCDTVYIIQTSIAGTNSDEVMLYPNPVSSILYIEFPVPVSNGTIIISDITGKVMVTETLNASNSIDVSNLSDGIYILSVKGDYNFRKKIVVKKE